MRRPKSIAVSILFAVCLGLAAVVGWLLMIRMPGRSFGGMAQPLTAEEKALRAELIEHVQKLSGDIGERNLRRYPQLKSAAEYIETELTSFGWQVRRDEYEVAGQTCWNLE